MPLILGTNSIKDTGYEVANSLRFDSASADSLTRSTSGAGTSNTTFTISLWVKKSSNDSAARRLLEFYNNSSYYISLRFRDDQSNRLDFYSESNGSGVNLRTTRSFRDPSSWYHIVMRVDTTQSTADDRLRMYVNGVQETDFAARTNPSSSENLQFNGSGDNQLISQSGSDTANNRRFNGYMAEVVFLDGQSLDPTSFGEFDEDSPTIWKPKDVSGLTFGNNGFYLDFENSGSLGADVSGNSNNFTVNNLTSVDQSTDTCTNNFATMNPLANTSGSQTFTQGNLNVDFPAGNDGRMYSTIGFSSGKFYTEFKIHSFTADRGHSVVLYTDITSTGLFLSFCKTGNANTITAFGSTVQSSLASFSAGDIIGMAVDADNGTVDFTRNGSAYGSQVTGLSSNFSGKDLFFGFFGEGHPTLTRVFNASVNFGGTQTPAFTISSGNSDGNGYGNFEYSVPSGYFSLNTKNLAEYG